MRNECDSTNSNKAPANHLLELLTGFEPSISSYHPIRPQI